MSSPKQAPNLERLLAVTHELESATDMEQLVQRLKVAASNLTTAKLHLSWSLMKHRTHCALLQHPGSVSNL